MTCNAHEVVRVEWRQAQDWESSTPTPDAVCLREAASRLGYARSGSWSRSAVAGLPGECTALADGPFLHVYAPLERRVLISELPHVSISQMKRRQLFLAGDYFLLSRHQAAVVHGSLVDFGGHSCAFLGPSGAGKSTSSQLMGRPGSILADDLFVASLTAQGAIGHSTSLDRRYSPQSASAIRALFLLTKSTSFSLTAIASRAALLRYMSENSRDLGMLPVEIRRFYLPWLHLLFQTVPAYDLAFRRDYIDVDAVQGVLTKPLPIPKVRPVTTSSPGQSPATV